LNNFVSVTKITEEGVVEVRNKRKKYLKENNGEKDKKRIKSKESKRKIKKKERK
jgi:hypothetical protein